MSKAKPIFRGFSVLNFFLFKNVFSVFYSQRRKKEFKEEKNLSDSSIGKPGKRMRAHLESVPLRKRMVIESVPLNEQF